MNNERRLKIGENWPKLSKKTFENHWKVGKKLEKIVTNVGKWSKIATKSSEIWQEKY